MKLVVQQVTILNICGKPVDPQLNKDSGVWLPWSSYG